jgi:hypothetical protein
MAGLKRDTTLTLKFKPKKKPSLFIKKHENDSASIPMRVSKINLDVKVVGNIATTVMDITFYNNLSRVLDGEFCFPLGEGQSVNYFAMEIGGVCT